MMAAVQQGEPSNDVEGELSSDTRGKVGSPASDTSGELGSPVSDIRGDLRLGGGHGVELSPPYLQGEMLGNQVRLQKYLERTTSPAYSIAEMQKEQISLGTVNWGGRKMFCSICIVNFSFELARLHL